MLVLSRQIGELIVIADDVVVTVAVIGADFVELLLQNMQGERIGVVTLGKSHDAHIARGVTAVFVQADESKVRIGFDSPEDHPPVQRGEYYPGGRRW